MERGFVHVDSAARRELLRYAVIGATVVAVLALYALWTATVATPGLAIPKDIFGDFRTNVWSPGRAILDGRTPFRGYTADGASGTVYPPAAFVSTLLFSLPPFGVAAAVWLVAQLTSVVCALRLCGVRDWRCFGLALASPPVVVGALYGNVSLVVMVAIAGIWVWRDRPARTGVLLGVVIAARLFLAPMLVWLVLSGRRRAASIAAFSAFIWSFGTWTAVAFRHLGDFFDVTRANVAEFADQGGSVASIAANVGASPTAIFATSVGAFVVALCIAGSRRADDLACFSWCLAGAILLSPIVWVHYYALMLVPLAIAAPAFSSRWLLPYVTVLQMTSWATAAMRVVSASSGVAFTFLGARASERPMSNSDRGGSTSPDTAAGRIGAEALR